MKKLASILVTGVAVVLVGCAAGPIDPADRDTTGAYDGVWLGYVSEPRASKVLLPGNWEMSCDWEEFQIYVVVDDGRIQLGKIESKSPVSKKGDFRIAVDTGAAQMTGGIMSGNSSFMEVFTGNLSEKGLTGKYSQFVPSIGGYGCSAKVRYEPYVERQS